MRAPSDIVREHWSGTNRMVQRDMITTLLARLTPSCKDVTYLASQAMDRSLPWSTRIKLQLHYWICEACTRYRDQLRTIRQTLRRSFEHEQANEMSSLSPASKARLTEAFRAKHE
jgi:3-methyladenine DNA glycosylase AlkC